MRQADAKFTDMSPQGRAVFRQAVESEKRLIRERGYLEFRDDNGVSQRIRVPVMPATMCAAFECPRIVVGRAVYCFDHDQQRRREGYA
ncbi:hypothetical protein WMF38_57800 [Sorangium sp. So ce118]